MKIKLKAWDEIGTLWGPVLIFSLAVILYCAGCYPIYTASKVRTLYQLYEDLHDMNLAEIDEEDEEIFADYQKEKFEIVIVDASFEPVYMSRSAMREQRIEKCIKDKVSQYTKSGALSERKREYSRSLILRGKITQDGSDYFVYLRKDVQAVLEVINSTKIYFGAVWVVVIVLSYLLSKKGRKKMQKQVRYSEYQLLESQREFVANISHELKTPLAVVSSQVEMLEIAGEKIDRSYYYASIHEELDKMSKMVGELLDFSMLDNQMSAMEMSRVNVSELAKYLLLRYDSIFRKNDIKLEQEIEENCFVYGNRMYLERAANNYLMNAFQHTEQGKRIRVTLKKEKKQICLEVYNDGEQIREDQMEHIWDSFYTTSQKKKPVTSENTIRNAGLGLFVVRKIIKRHNGTCGVKNLENGVLFWIRLSEMNWDEKPQTK